MPSTLSAHRSSGRRSAHGCLCLGALAILTVLSVGISAEEEAPARLDWVPIEALDEERKETLRAGCCGAYVAPVREDAEALMAPEEASVRAQADRAERQGDGEMTLEGDVYITHGYRSVQAECARFDQINREAEASGDIAIREPGALLRAERAQMDLDTGDARLDGAQFVLYESRFRGSADILEKVGEESLTLTRSQVTTCEPGSNEWALAGSEITIYPDQHYGTARHARLEILNVPVFYFPYLRFPVGDERQTGFLFPSLGESRRDGVEFSLPFYWNIAPNYDMTITPNYMSKRGTLWQVENRHLAAHFETTLSGSWIASDDGGYNRRLENQIARGEITEEEAYPYRGEERWQLNLDHSGGEGQRWSTLIDYTDLSDNDYLRDLDSSGLDVNRAAVVSKTARAGYQSEHWNLGIKAEELRSLTTAKWPHRELPRINADGRYAWGDWLFDLNNEYAYFDVNSTFESENESDIENIIVGERLRTDYGITWNGEWLGGFFKPRAGVKTLSYDLREDNLVEDANSTPSLAAPQGTLDTGLYFERYGSLFGDAYLHTFEPRLFYFYSDYEDHGDLFGLTENNRPVNFDTKPLTFSYDQLYRTTRLAGGDRIEDANQLSVGLTTRFIDPLRGTEHLSLSVGQILYFEDRRIGLSEHEPSKPPEEGEELDEIPDHERPRSELAGQINARVNDRMVLTSNVAYDEFEHEVSSANLSLRYMDEERRIFNLSYRFNRRPPSPGQLNPEEELDRSRDQIDASFHWPIYGQWSLMARGYYDLTYERELDTFVGLEYDDCCYRVRVLARRWLDFDYTSSPNFLETVGPEDRERSIVLDIQFKGLGSINRKVGALLEKAIPGYGDRESYYSND